MKDIYGVESWPHLGLDKRTKGNTKKTEMEKVLKLCATWTDSPWTDNGKMHALRPTGHCTDLIQQWLWMLLRLQADQLRSRFYCQRSDDQ